MPWKKDGRGAVAVQPPMPERKDEPVRSGGMDAGQIRVHMEDAERRVAEAERLANGQRALAGALARGGHDAAEALRLLRILEQRLALEEADRDRTRRELVALKRREG